MENNRELVLRMADGEQELISAVNLIMHRHSLPCFLMECVIDKIHRQLVDGKAGEVAAAKDRESKKEEVSK